MIEELMYSVYHIFFVLAVFLEDAKIAVSSFVLIITDIVYWLIS